MTGYFIRLFLLLCLVPYAFAVIMPTWRWLLATTLVVGSLIGVLWFQDWIVTSDPQYHEGVGGPLGRAMFAFVTIGFISGIAIRGLTLILRSRGLRLSYIFVIRIVGLAVPPAIFFLPGLWHAWKNRPPSGVCQNATFNVKIAGADFAIPAKSMFNVYLGRTSRRDAYYFNMPPSLRDFCSLNNNGKLPVKATNIWLQLHNFGLSTPALCVTPVAGWATTYCTAHDAAKHTKEDSVDFPLDIHVFAPDEVNMGEFLGSRSTYEDSLSTAPQVGGPVFIKSDQMVSGQPLTFKCNKNGSGYWCTTSYPWRDGANLGYAFRSGADEVIARGNRIDIETRKFLSGFQTKP
jgi:hypothetical protein